MRDVLAIAIGVFLLASCSSELPRAPQCPENVAVSVFATPCPSAPGCSTCTGTSENGNQLGQVTGCEALPGLGGGLCVESCDACPP